MEPSLAPLRAPPLWGQLVICNLLFAQFGGCQEASSTRKHNADNVRLFMDQEPSFQVCL